MKVHRQEAVDQRQRYTVGLHSGVCLERGAQGGNIAIIFT